MKQPKFEKLNQYLITNNEMLKSVVGGITVPVESTVDTKKKDVDSTSQDSASNDHFD